MEITYLPQAVSDIAYFKKLGDKAIQKKIEKLLVELMKHPETGTGQIEQMKYDLAGYWSRRINGEHRIVYKINYEADVVKIYSLKEHY